MNPQTIHSVIPPDYVTKPEAMKILNRSLKRFEAAVKDAGVTTEYVENKGTRPIAIYRRADIEGIRDGRTIAAPKALAPLGERIAAGLARLDNRDKLKAIAPPAAAPVTTVSIAEKHLVSQTEAHALGYPVELLRQWKNSDNPPGIRYGKTGFKFSVPALAKRMEKL